MTNQTEVKMTRDIISYFVTISRDSSSRKQLDKVIEDIFDVKAFSLTLSRLRTPIKPVVLSRELKWVSVPALYRVFVDTRNDLHRMFEYIYSLRLDLRGMNELIRKYRRKGKKIPENLNKNFKDLESLYRKSCKKLSRYLGIRKSDWKDFEDKGYVKRYSELRELNRMYDGDYGSYDDYGAYDDFNSLNHLLDYDYDDDRDIMYPAPDTPSRGRRMYSTIGDEYNMPLWNGDEDEDDDDGLQEWMTQVDDKIDRLASLIMRSGGSNSTSINYDTFDNADTDQYDTPSRKSGWGNKNEDSTDLELVLAAIGGINDQLKSHAKAINQIIDTIESGPEYEESVVEETNADPTGIVTQAMFGSDSTEDTSTKMIPVPPDVEDTDPNTVVAITADQSDPTAMKTEELVAAVNDANGKPSHGKKKS